MLTWHRLVWDQESDHSPLRALLCPPGSFTSRESRITTVALGKVSFSCQTQGTFISQSFAQERSHLARGWHQNILQYKRTHVFEQPDPICLCTHWVFLCDIHPPLTYEEHSHYIHHQFHGFAPEEGNHGILRERDSVVRLLQSPGGLLRLWEPGFYTIHWREGLLLPTPPLQPHT